MGGLWSRLGIQSKVLIGLLIVSILSTLIVGYLGYRSGSDALRKAAFQRLTAQREARARELEVYERNERNLVLSFSFDPSFAAATRQFSRAFDTLERTPLRASQQAKVDKYYDDVFLPRLAENVSSTPTAQSYIPESPAAGYLQLNYTTTSDDFDTLIQIDDAEDGSAWSRIHRRYHPYFRDSALRFGFDDVLLIDNAGRVVYSAYKGVDLGTDLERGPYSATPMADAFREVRAANDAAYVAVTDFETYRPSYGLPTSFMLTSIVTETGELDGVLAVQLPSEDIDTILTSGRRWSAEGQGETGETFVAGQDQILRSNPRALLEDPKTYARQARAAGVPQPAIDAAVRRESAVLLQPSRTAGVTAALRGQTGTVVARDYRGKEVLGAYKPLELEGLNWVIVAKQDTSEAFAPVRDFTRLVAISTAGIVLAVCVLGLLLAQLFARPIRRLTAGVRRVAAGDYEAEIPVTSNDELGDLGRAFNEMSRSLQVKSELVEEQQRENQRLLLNIMPEDLAQRYRQGEGDGLAQAHANVTVLYADVAGLGEAAAALPPERSAELINELIGSIDDAAEAAGVDKMRTTSSGYLASCGLVVPRIDHTRRMVDFAERIVEIVQRFNAAHDLELRLRVGIDTGAVTAGLLGQSKFVYDIWGDTVNVANSVLSAGTDGVFVTPAVHERVRDTYTFAPAGEVEARDGSRPVWRLLVGERVG